MRKYLLLIPFVYSLLASEYVQSQGSNYDYKQLLGQNNPISTAVPFLMIAPDSRAGAMGDAGAATSPDGYSQNWNSSKFAFIESPLGLTISYTPWLKKLVDDINLAYISGYYRLDKNQTVGASLRYFSMGNINFTNNDGDPMGSYSPHELAFDASYNRKLTDHFALGIAGRFIYSNLTGGIAQEGYDAVSAGKSAAIDVNGFYKQPMTVSGYKGNWALGFNISNVGAKLGYTEEKNFIPTNLRIGGATTIDLDAYNSISFTIDFNKLLVPTPPIDTIIDGEHVVLYGKDNNVGIVQGMVQSFNDAPDGFSEEVDEINYSIGLEYWYAKQFAVRAGYFYENPNKGNRKYFTAGVGLKMKVLGLDFAYLIPAGNYGSSPLDNTWRFSIFMNFEDFAKQ